jgi:hypothetical protein
MFHLLHPIFMDAPIHIVSIDRLHDGLFLYFSDGTHGFYPDTLLHSWREHPEVLLTKTVPNPDEE